MNYFKRATTSIKRRPIKSVIFLILIILLGALTAGAITVRQAITNTDANLRRRMPAIMMVEAKNTFYEATGEWSNEWLQGEVPILTPELIREIADMRYVEFFDYAIDVGHWAVTSADLTDWYVEGLHIPIMWGNNRIPEYGASIVPRGVSAPDFMEARDGLISLSAGRTFTETELTERSEVIPVMMSTALAEVNGLTVNDTFESRLAIWDTGESHESVGFLTHEEQGFEAVVDESFTMQIIGLFEAVVPDIPDEMELAFPILNQNSRTYHRIYLPNIIAEEMFNLVVYGESSLGWREEGEIPQILHFFTLADPMYRNDFARAIERLDGDWQVTDLSTGFGEISASMDNMSELADFILIGSVGATILIISLLVLLFLRDRKHEIGVYLAMGDKKDNIIKQMILELIPLALIGLTLALFVGNLISANISGEMIRQDLLANPPTQESVQRGGRLEQLGYRFTFSHEEMLASYEITLDGTTIGLFYGIGLATVLISTLVPITFAVNVDPKKLLMTEQIQ